MIVKAGEQKLEVAEQYPRIAAPLLPARATHRQRSRTCLLIVSVLACATFLTSAPRAFAATALQVIVEPQAGIAPIYDLLAGAKHTVDLAMYELSDSKLEALLVADAMRGVRVRVLLDRTDEESTNTPAFRLLSAQGVQVHWASSRFALTHEKAAVVDDRVALVMTLNFVAQDYPTTRDFAVIDSQPRDVAAIEQVFSGDWNGGANSTPDGDGDLVWSPGAEPALVSLIDSAHSRLLVENEEMDDPYITAPLEEAARRGVDVEIVMTDDASWASAFAALRAAGAHVRTDGERAPLYIHAKAIVVDPGTSRAQAFVGSQNFSITSLLHNRELGIITSANSVVATIAATITNDFDRATPWT